MKKRSMKFYNQKSERKIKRSQSWKANICSFNTEGKSVWKSNQRIRKTSQLNFVMLGHVDSGKSTTLGHLLYKAGGVKKMNLDYFKEIES